MLYVTFCEFPAALGFLGIVVGFTFNKKNNNLLKPRPLSFPIQTFKALNRFRYTYRERCCVTSLFLTQSCKCIDWNWLSIHHCTNQLSRTRCCSAFSHSILTPVILYFSVPAYLLYVKMGCRWSYSAKLIKKKTAKNNNKKRENNKHFCLSYIPLRVQKRHKIPVVISITNTYHFHLIRWGSFLIPFGSLSMQRHIPTQRVLLSHRLAQEPNEYLHISILSVVCSFGSMQILSFFRGIHLILIGNVAMQIVKLNANVMSFELHSANMS